MVDRGLIERVPGPGRSVHHELTEKGRQLCSEGAEIVDRVLTRSFAELTPPQLETFDKLLVQLLSA
jgi:DNA-binding MarR family transcriptional regulator